MKKRPLYFLTSAALLFLGVQNVPASVQFVGISIPWIEGQMGELPNQTDGDTVGGNPGWNAYLRSTDGSFVATGAFLNSGDGDGLRFDLTLSPRAEPYLFEIVLQTTTWADNSPNNPGSYINLFFDGDRNSPGISAKLAGGNTGALEPLTVDDAAEVVNDNGGFVEPAGTLEYVGPGGIATLTEYSMTGDGTSNEVGAFSDLPSPDGQNDSVLSFAIVVIPEPSTSLLALLGLGLCFRRRR